MKISTAKRQDNRNEKLANKTSAVLVDYSKIDKILFPLKEREKRVTKVNVLGSMEIMNFEENEQLISEISVQDSSGK